MEEIRSRNEIPQSQSLHNTIVIIIIIIIIIITIIIIIIIVITIVITDKQYHMLTCSSLRKDPPAP